MAPHTSNGKSQKGSKNGLEFETKPEDPITEDMEPLSYGISGNEMISQDASADRLDVATDNAIKCIADAVSTLEEQVLSNEKTEVTNNTDFTENIDYSKNTVIEIVSLEIMDSPDIPLENNNETQGSKYHSSLGLDQEVINDPDPAITEVTIPPKDAGEISVSHTDLNMKVDTKEEVSMVVKELASEKDETQGDTSNSSDMKLKHMMSLKVVLEQAKFISCPNCNLVFFRQKDLKLHSVKHLLPSDSYGDDEYERFVKRYNCEKCDLRFVLWSTLQAHRPVHEPYPHTCSCGVGYYRAGDLAAHRRLVHLDEIKQELTQLTDRKQRALKHQIWEPNLFKKEPNAKAKSKKRQRGTPKVKIEPKQRRKPEIEPYTCEEMQLIAKNDDGTFSCPICHKRYKSKSGVQVHLGAHASVKPYRCDECGGRFTQRSALKTHKKLHTGVKEFACGFCGKEFSTYHNMLNHVRTHTGVKPFKCDFCPMAFSDQSAHKRHVRTHTGERPYACLYCDKTFSDASQHIVHTRRHTGNRKFPCARCRNSFYTKSDLKKHTDTVHGHRKDHVCRICNKSYALKQYLDLHMKRHESGERFECDYCGRRYRFKQVLVNHIGSLHLQVKQAKCPDCGMKFFANDRLKKHYIQVHERPLAYQCDYCGKRESLKSLLFKHIVGKHSKVSCERCRRRFVNGADLRKHNQKGCLRCSCGKYFKSPNELASHQISHDPTRPYLCSFCDKRFKIESCLRNHYMSKHTNTELFECDECGKKYSTRNQIVSHLKIHCKLRVYCHLCRQVFYSEANLENHKAKKLCLKTHKCDSCGKIFCTRSKLLYHLQEHDAWEFHCAHCSKKCKRKPAISNHIKRCHKHLFRSKSRHSK